MITIGKNINFSNWFDIRFFGKLIDNAKTEAQAMEIAEQLKKEQSKQGKKVFILNAKEV
tara:strand:- start:735 stop:911 length:177 start_codon:yes stop_codon:yes gene_type:complete